MVLEQGPGLIPKEKNTALSTAVHCLATPDYHPYLERREVMLSISAKQSI